MINAQRYEYDKRSYEEKNPQVQKKARQLAGLGRGITPENQSNREDDRPQGSQYRQSDPNQEIYLGWDILVKIQLPSHLVAQVMPFARGWPDIDLPIDSNLSRVIEFDVVHIKAVKNLHELLMIISSVSLANPLKKMIFPRFRSMSEIISLEFLSQINLSASNPLSLSFWLVHRYGVSRFNSAPSGLSLGCISIGVIQWNIIEIAQVIVRA